MENFWRDNKIFFAVIIWAFIVGGFIYLGLKNDKQKQNNVLNIVPVQKIQSLPNNQLKISSVPEKTNNDKCGATENTYVTKVIDGDTVVVEGGYHVRLVGIDADEKGYPCYDVAKTRLEGLVLGKMVKLEKDKTDVDQYGRCLRNIFIGDLNVDAQLVREGLAVARFYQPDIKYRDQIASAERNAREAGVGCKWSGLSQTK